MTRKRMIPSLLLAVLLVSLLASQAAPQGTLLVNIEPKVYLEAPASLVWDNAGDAQSFEIPLAVKVRLNRGTFADLSISRADSLPGMEPGSEAGGLPGVAVEASGGLTPLSEAAVVLQRFSRSGVYPYAMVLRLAAPPPSGSYLIPLFLELKASDGLTMSSVPLTVRLERP